jgi:hypothetical protein
MVVLLTCGAAITTLWAPTLPNAYILLSFCATLAGGSCLSSRKARAGNIFDRDRTNPSDRVVLGVGHEKNAAGDKDVIVRG